MSKATSGIRLIGCLSLAIFFVFSIVFSIRGQQQPADPNQGFFDAIRKGDSATITAMLKKEPLLAKAVRPSGTTALQYAGYAKQKEIIDILLATGIEPDIFEAAAIGRADRVRELLKKDPSLAKAWSADGWTALHLNFGNLEIVKLTLDNGADINAFSKNKLVATPLQGAVVQRNFELTKLLLDRGAKVNPHGEGGGTPLHEVSDNGDVEIAKLLLEHGADINAKDDDGKTPLAYAKTPEMEKLLREHGAK